MLLARSKMHVLWADLRKTDVYSHGMVQFNQFLHIFEKNRQLIWELVKVEDVRDFFEIFDTNNDG
jgi:Ca2+-binding EF-hand superfamily protein